MHRNFGSPALLANSLLIYRAKVVTGSYFDERRDADIYFAYCWPSQMMRLEEHFSLVAPNDSLLLICHGTQDIRCKVKKQRPSQTL